MQIIRAFLLLFSEKCEEKTKRKGRKFLEQEKVFSLSFLSSKKKVNSIKDFM